MTQKDPDLRDLVQPVGPAPRGSLVITSAPLEWTDILVERHFFDSAHELSEPVGARSHRVLIWDQPISCAITIGGRQMTFDGTTTDFLVIPAGASVVAAPLGGVPYTKIVLARPLVERVAREFLGAPPVAIEAFVGSRDPAFHIIARMLLEAATGQAPLDDQMLAVIAREAAIRLVQHYSDQRFERRDLAGKLPVANLIRVLDLVTRDLSQTLTVAAMAREAGYSRSYFTRAFKLSTGRSPHAYVVSRRVAMAAHLLRATDLSLSEIAARCHFHDQPHFNRLFKAAHGTTPRVYRRRHRASPETIPAGRPPPA